ncbi:unnamed protein product, partial [Scytosiphon promiscuus]
LRLVPPVFAAGITGIPATNTMPTTEAYQPGLLSSLLLGGGPAAAGGEGLRPPPAAAAAAAAEAGEADGVLGGAAEPSPAPAAASSTKKKKKKSKKSLRDGDTEAVSDASGVRAEKNLSVEDGGSNPAAVVTPPPEGVVGLASLFSPSNLQKFKRRERADKEADAAEVARISEEARARERREEEEAANAGKKKNKKAKKREQEEQENRRKLEAEKRLEIAAKRTAALAAAAAAVGAKGPKTAETASDEEDEDEGEEEDEGEGEDDDEDEDDGEEEDEDEGGSDSEPESVIAGQGGDSSDEEMDDLEEDEAAEEKGKQEAAAAGAGAGGGGAKEGKAKGKDGAGEAAESKPSAISKKEREEEDKELRTVFVGNLPTSFNPKKVKAVFKEYGKVESVRLRSVAVQGMAVDKAGDQQLVRKVCVNRGMVDEEIKSSINAYVVYKDMASVEKALAANGTDVGGKHVRVDRAKTGEYDHTRSVFLGNLPMDAGEEEVRALFASKLEGGAQAVEGVRLVRDKATLVGKGFGYVLLTDRALAAAALALQGTKLKGRPLRVMPCGKRTKGRGGVAKPGMEDHKFASFEGRRTTDAGVMRRLKRKQEGADDGDGSNKNASSASNGSAGGRGGGRGGRGGGRGGGDGGSDRNSGSGFKKPRWTNEVGDRAGKTAGGRGPARAAVIPTPTGRGRGRGGGRGGRGSSVSE